MDFTQPFSPHSARIDWCERNYEITPYVAEFFNTVSNLIFIVVPPSLGFLFRQYSSHVNSGVNLVLALFVVIGLSSAYFHATLSLFGQLLDEIAILWVMLLAFGLWTPQWAINNSPFKGRRESLQRCMMVLALATTTLGFLRPEVNAFVLATISLPLVVMMSVHIYRTNEAACFRLGFQSLVFWVLAIFCWLSDRLLCNMWISLSFPYLHCIWHVLVFVASYQGLVIGAYVHAQEEYSSLQPKIDYLSFTPLYIHIPYVVLCNVKERTV